ncbi:MAG: molybdopterin-binding/glycosyltransferase family 2 protein [Rhodospirillales bacterium]
MKFGAFPVDEVEGAILAHSLKGTGFAFRKGRVLTSDDVAVLRRAGIGTVVAARLEPGDIGEDEAAARLAAALIGGGADADVHPSVAATGRCNLFAAAAGVARIDAGRIDAINLIDEALTVATLPPFARVAAGEMLATVKIIPFAAPQAAVVRGIAVAGDGPPPLRVAAFAPHRAGLVQTRLAGLKASLLTKTRQVTAARLEALGSRLAADTVVAHETAAVAAAIERQRQDGCDPILVLGASAIVDRRDVVPSAVVHLGGRVIHLGMPVDPGNLLMLAAVGATRIVGLPGCARSPRTNGCDWVLERLLAGLPVDGADIMRMGVGGLLSEIPARPLPRRQATESPTAEPPPAAKTADPSPPPPVAAVILAAGRGSRFAGGNKLIAAYSGVPLVRRATEAALASQAMPVVVVVGHHAAAIEAALAGLPVRIVENGRYREGLSTSLGGGIAALPASVAGALILLADMPLITAAHLDRLIAAFRSAPGEPAVCIPVHAGRRGNPVLWPARLFPALMALEGDVGGRALFAAAEPVLEVAMADPAVLLDVDDAQALAALATAGG